MKKENFESMKKYFDSVLDPFNLETFSRSSVKMDLEKAIKWYHDSSIRYAHSLMEPFEGKHILDIGCGTGTHLIWLARQGARVTGIDISEKRIESAKKVIKDQGLEEKASLYVRNGKNTDFPSETFDIIYGQDVLMFLEGKYAPLIKEAKRILKKGGSLIFSEALDRHPIAACYRKYAAPAKWQKFTHYFKLQYLENFKKEFNYVNYKTFYLTAFFLYAVKMYTPFYKLFNLIDRTFGVMDSNLLKAFPALEKYSWRIIFEARK